MSDIHFATCSTCGETHGFGYDEIGVQVELPACREEIPVSTAPANERKAEAMTPLDSLTLKILHSDQIILVKQKNGDQLTVNGYSPSRNRVRLEDLWYSPEELLSDWTYLDGRPLGFEA